jgi:putative spermidine/putrescine transport system substrate-binding protein
MQLVRRVVAPLAGVSRIAMAAVLALTACLGVAACGGSSKETGLTIGGWGGIVDEATQKGYLSEFDAQNKTKSQFVDAPAVQGARIEAQNAAKQIQWDAVDSMAADAAFTAYSKGQVDPLPASTKAQFERELGPQKVTAFGISHGSLGDVIVCNTDKMKTCPTTMAQFFDTKAFPQQRMYGGIEPIEAVTVAEVAAGMPVSQTATTPVDVKAVIKTLEGLKPHIKAFWQNGDQQQQIMRSGEVPMGIMWSDRAYQLISQGMKLKLVWTDGVYEPSYWAVLKGAPNSALGFKLLSWIAEHPKGEAKWAEIMHDSVPNPAALRYMPASIALQLADNPVNLRHLATPNFAWYAQHKSELDTAYENFLRG